MGGSFLIFSLGSYIVSNSLSLAISVGSGLLYPGVFMFRRNSCWSQTHIDDEGNIVYTYDIMEYWPDTYLAYSFFISLGFIQLNFALKNNASIISQIIWIVCAVIFCSLMLSPDILRKKLPFKNEMTFHLFEILIMIYLIIFLSIFAIIIKH